MPNLSWWDEDEIDSYLDAFRELMLPQTTVLVGNHSTLWRWLLPDWNGDRTAHRRATSPRPPPSMGVPYTLVTGMPLPDQFIDNVLASPQAVLASEKFELFEAVFAGAGDTLSAALAALLASGTDLGGRHQRSAGLPGPLPGRGLSPRHGQRRARPLVLGPARRRRRGRRRARRASTMPGRIEAPCDAPPHDTKH